MSRVRNLVDFNFRTSDFDGDTNDDVTFNNLTVNGTFAISNAGNTTFTAGGNLTLDATNRVIVQDTPIKLASMTTTVRDALSSPLDGDLIYNTTNSKVEARENGAWVAVSTGAGGSSLNIQDEGSGLTTAAAILNFVGNGVVASGTGSTKTITISGGGSGVTIQDEGGSLATLGTTLNFVGSGVTVTGTTATKTITIPGGGGSGIASVVADTSPQLGGDLDVNGADIISLSNTDIDLDPNGSGKVVFKGNATKGSGQFVLNCEQNSHGIIIKGPPHSAGATYTLTLPTTDGNASEVLQTDGAGVLSWVAQSGGGGGIASVAADTSPQLGGNLDVAGKDIVSVSNGDIEVKPNGSGDIHLETQTGMLRINRASGGTGVNLGSHNMYLNSDSFTTGTSVSIGLQPGTDTGTTTNAFGFLRMTRESNTSGEFSIHVANESSPAGTYYVTTFGGAADNGTVSFDQGIFTKAIIERAFTLSASTGQIDFDFSTRGVAFCTSQQTANRTVNFRWDASTTLDSVLANNQSVTAAILNTQGATPYYFNVIQIDGVAVTPKWQGGSAPTAGLGNGAGSIDVYSFTIIKNVYGTYCIASVTPYA